MSDPANSRPDPAATRPRADKSRDFRWHLREATRAEHDALDLRISTLDLTRAEDLVQFLALHAASFRAMARHVEDEGLAQMIAVLDADLATLGATAPAPVPDGLAAIDPLAARYILSGSRMGTQVLRRRWAAASDPDVRAASAYFSLPQDPKDWPETCAALSAVAPQSARAAAIVADSRAVFAVFAGTLDDMERRASA